MAWTFARLPAADDTVPLSPSASERAKRHAACVDLDIAVFAVGSLSRGGCYRSDAIGRKFGCGFTVGGSPDQGDRRKRSWRAGAAAGAGDAAGGRSCRLLARHRA